MDEPEELKVLTTTSGWRFEISQGKKGKWRWQLYNPSKSHICGSSVRGFDNLKQAENDIYAMCDALDKKLLHSLFK